MVTAADPIVKAEAELRLPSNFMEHPQIVDVGPLCAALWLAAKGYAIRHCTGDEVPAAAMAELLNDEFCGPRDSTGRAAVWTVAATCGFRGLDLDELIDQVLIPTLIDATLLEETDGGYRVIELFDDHEAVALETTQSN